MLGEVVHDGNEPHFQLLHNDHLLQTLLSPHVQDDELWSNLFDIVMLLLFGLGRFSTTKNTQSARKCKLEVTQIATQKKEMDGFGKWLFSRHYVSLGDESLSKSLPLLLTSGGKKSKEKTKTKDGRGGNFLGLHHLSPFVQIPCLSSMQQLYCMK